MNRKTLLGLGAALALFTVAPLRADGPASNFHYSVGYKAWATHWTTWDGDREGNLLAMTDSAMAHVPNVSFRYKNWVWTGSYVSTSRFNFPAINDDFYAPPADLYYYSAKRKEWDLNFGYMFNTNPGTSLGVSVGYKDVTQDFRVVNIYGGVTQGYPYSNEFDFMASGPTVGLAGSASLGNGFALYGNAAGSMWMKVKSKAYTPSGSVTSGSAYKKGNYESAELGLAWRKNMIQLSLGYRYQVLETKFKSGYQNNGQDVTRGYTFGISFVQ